jgi:hypothetical protein
MAMQRSILMANATDFLKSNFLNAAAIPPGVIIETMIVSARPHEFEEGEIKLVVYVQHEAKGIVLNVTRLRVMIGAFGSNFDTWPGKMVRIFRGETMYSGKKVDCVEIEAVNPVRIPTEQRPALELVGRETDADCEAAPPIDERPFSPEDDESIPF